MIAYIKGTVGQILDQSVIIENQGIGYIIGASPVTLSKLPPVGESAKIYTFLQVKEDDLSLFGFLNQEEIRLFRMLISISGIGPKVAMSVLAVMSPDQIMSAIANQDSMAFSKVPGVGKKTAQRITLELQDKIKLQGQENILAVAGQEKQDAIEALLTLGYSRSESLKAVLAVAAEDMQTDEIIRLALRKIM